MSWGNLAASIGIRDQEKDLRQAIEDMRKWRDAKRAHRMDAFSECCGLTRSAFTNGVVLYNRTGNWPKNWKKEDVAHARKYIDMRDQMPKMPDVYAHYDLPVRTAWSVLNNRHPLSKSTKEKIAKAYARKGPYRLT